MDYYDVQEKKRQDEKDKEDDERKNLFYVTQFGICPSCKAQGWVKVYNRYSIYEKCNHRDDWGKEVSIDYSKVVKIHSNRHVSMPANSLKYRTTRETNSKEMNNKEMNNKESKLKPLAKSAEITPPSTEMPLRKSISLRNHNKSVESRSNSTSPVEISPRSSIPKKDNSNKVNNMKDEKNKDNKKDEKKKDQKTEDRAILAAYNKLLEENRLLTKKLNESMVKTESNPDSTNINKSLDIDKMMLVGLHSHMETEHVVVIISTPTNKDNNINSNNDKYVTGAGSPVGDRIICSSLYDCKEIPTEVNSDGFWFCDKHFKLLAKPRKHCNLYDACDGADLIEISPGLFGCSLHRSQFGLI